jgi:uncharacterized membrane protein
MRSLAKTAAYRSVAIVLLAGITYIYTGNIGVTTIVTTLFNVTATVAYYALERAWDLIDWGRTS